MSGGKPWKTENDPEYDALAAVPCLVDHDGDGDLDLLIGNIGGTVIYIPNEGTPKKYAFDSSKRTTLPGIKVEGDSGPVAADWDGDGRTDLVVGSGDGSVWWYRNTSPKGAAAYAPGVELLPKSKGGYGSPVPNGGAPSAPGNRTKVAVVDWNGDGRMDLMVGDIWYEAAAATKLTAEQTARRDELKKKDAAIIKEYQERYAKLKDKAEEDPEIKRLLQELGEVRNELSPLEPRATPRGSVWLYLREPPAK